MDKPYFSSGPSCASVMREHTASRRRMRTPSVMARMREWFAFTRFECEFLRLPISVVLQQQQQSVTKNKQKKKHKK